MEDTSITGKYDEQINELHRTIQLKTNEADVVRESLREQCLVDLSFLITVITLNHPSKRDRVEVDDPESHVSRQDDLQND